MRQSVCWLMAILFSFLSLLSCSNGTDGGARPQTYLVRYELSSVNTNIDVTYWDENNNEIVLTEIPIVAGYGSFVYEFQTSDVMQTIGIIGSYYCTGPFCSSVNVPVTVKLYIDGVLVDEVFDSGGWPEASIGPDTIYNFLYLPTPTLHVTKILDAFVANEGRAEISWWNDGSGLFYKGSQNADNLDSRSAAIGDLDGDGDLDAFVANDGHANKVYLINAYGTFLDSGQNGLTLGFDRSFGVALGDLDGDSDLDAFVANYGEANKVYFNDGSGTFSDSSQTLGQNNSYAVVLGDLDGDGDLDAFVVNDGGPNTIYFNDGSGKFADSGQSLGNQNSFGVALDNLDGDSDIDAFVVNNKDGNKVYLNNGNGVFVDSGQNLGPDTDVSTGIALGDVNGDGAIDAFVVNGGQPNRIYLNDGLGAFIDSGQKLDLDDSSSVDLGDVDDDGDLDAFIANRDGQPNKVYFNNGVGFFYDSGQELGTNDSMCVILGKFNP